MEADTGEAERLLKQRLLKQRLGAKLVLGEAVIVQNASISSDKMTTGEVTSWAAQTKSYVTESLAELKKITRPTWQETWNASLVTLALMIFMSICLFVLDLLFSKIVSSLLM